LIFFFFALFLSFNAHILFADEATNLESQSAATSSSCLIGYAADDNMKKPATPVEEKPVEPPTSDDVTIKPVVKEPASPTTDQPAVVKPVAVKPAVVKPTVVKPAVYKASVGKSASAEAPATKTIPPSKESSKSVEAPPSSTAAVDKMKYNYRDDQWSPQHQEGARVYTSDFLLQFRNIEVAMAKPTNLPSIDDIILNQPLKSSRDVSSTPFNDLYMGDSGGRSDFTPNYMGGPHHGGHGGGGRGGSRNRGPPNRQTSMSKQPKVIKLPTREKAPEIKVSENAWRPKTKEELDDTAEVLRNVRSILNKLTPQKLILKWRIAYVKNSIDVVK
jgi:hypothetical protein